MGWDSHGLVWPGAWRPVMVWSGHGLCCLWSELGMCWLEQVKVLVGLDIVCAGKGLRWIWFGLTMERAGHALAWQYSWKAMVRAGHRLCWPWSGLIMCCGELSVARDGLFWTRTGLNMGWAGRGSAGPDLDVVRPAHWLCRTWVGLEGYSKHGQDWLWPGMDTSNFEIFRILTFSKI
jgi:hypothetical protein